MAVTPSTVNFGTDTLAADPADFTSKWDHSANDFPVAAQVEGIGAQAVRHLDATAGEYAMQWDTPGTGQANVFLLMRIRCTSGSGVQAGIVMRGAGTGGAEEGYVVRISGTELELGEFSAGVFTQLAITSGLALLPNHWYWLEAEADGTAIEARIYLHGASRPGSADVSANDATHASGWMGLYAGNGSGARYLDYLEADTATIATLPTGSGSFTAVAKSTEGVHLYDSFDRADGDIDAASPDVGPDWQILAGNNKPQIVSNAVRMNNGDTTPVEAYIILADQDHEELVVVSRGTRNNTQMTHSFWYDQDATTPIAEANRDGYRTSIAWTGGFPVHDEFMYRADNDVYTSLGTASGQWFSDGGADYEGRIVLAPGLQWGANGAAQYYDAAYQGDYKHFWINQEDLGTGYTEMAYLAVFRTSRLTVKDLPDGYTIEWGGLSATAQGGIAVIQVGGGNQAASYIDPTLVVKDTLAAIVQTIAETGTVGLGSTYALSGTPPDTPTLAASAVTATTVQLDGSTYSGGAPGVILDAVQFQTDDSSAGFGSIVDDQTFTNPPAITLGVIDLASSKQHWSRVRYRSSAGVWSSWSAAATYTTLAAIAPTTPVITVSAITETSAILTIGAFASSVSGVTHGATSWEVDEDGGGWAANVFESLEDGIHLLTINVTTGLAASLPFDVRARVRGSDGVWSAYGAADFSTVAAPATAPDKPTLVIASFGQTTVNVSAGYNHGSAEAHASSQWQAWKNAGLTDLHKDTGEDAANLLTYGFIELTPGTQFWFRTRQKDASGDWSPWSDAVAQTTAATPLAGSGEQSLQVNRPWAGEPVTGAAYSVQWRPANPGGNTVFDIDYSADAGVTWTNVVTGTASSPYAWDTSALAEGGLYEIRVRARDTVTTEATAYSYALFPVDHGNLGSIFARGDDWLAEGDLDDWTELWNSPGLVNWLGPYSSADPVKNGVIIGVNNSGALRPDLRGALVREDYFQPQSVDLFTRLSIGGGEGGFIWSRYQDTEQRTGGPAAVILGDATSGPLSGLQADLELNINWPFGTCEEKGRGSAFLNVIMRGTPIVVAVPVGSVHALVRNCEDGNEKWEWYDVHLRLTIIRSNADGTKDVAVRAKVRGRSISEPTSNGWHYETTAEGVDLQCASPGIIATGPNFGAGWTAFTSFGAVAYAYGTCEAPEGNTEPLEACPDPALDLTIFGDDDATPILGSVDGAGEIVEASFSTLPDHPRPYLKLWRREPEVEVDPVNGLSTIGSMQARVLDKRLDACDPKTGLVTSILPDPAGFSALIGRRVLARRRLSDGVWIKVLDGVLYSVDMDSTIVTYLLELRDIQERARDVSIFVDPNKRDQDAGTVEPTWSVLPRGPTDAYGIVGDFSGPTPFAALMLPTSPLQGRVESLPGSSAVTPQDGFGARILTPVLGLSNAYRSYIRQLGAATERFDASGLSVGMYWEQVAVRWRSLDFQPGGPWKYTGIMPVPVTLGPVIEPLPEDVNVFVPVGSAGQYFIQFNSADTTQMPTIFGEDIEFQVVSLQPPDDDVPFVWDGQAGRLLQNIWDGDYSFEDPKIRYDAASMTAFIGASPFVRFIQRTSVGDMRKWVSENILAPLRYMAIPNAEGLLELVSTDVPDESTSLPTLDDTAAAFDIDWTQDGGRAVPIVDYKWHVEYLVTDPNLDYEVRDVNVREWERLVRNSRPVGLERTIILEREIHFVRVHKSAGFLGSARPLELQPVTIRDVGAPNTGELVETDFISAIGAQLAQAKMHDVLSRYAFGPILVSVPIRDTAALKDSLVGDWVLYNLDWLPNYDTAERGGTRLGLIVRSQKNENLLRHITLLDAGPGLGGLPLPAIAAAFASGFDAGFQSSGLTVATDGRVTIPLQVPSGFSPGFGSGFSSGIVVRVEIAVAPTEPAATSGQWLPLTVTSTSGSIVTPPQPSSSTVWVRARSESPRHRPSAWTAAASIATPATPKIHSLKVELNAAGVPTVSWTGNAALAALRLEYDTHNDGTDPIWPDLIDIQAGASGSYAFTSESVTTGERFSVRATPYPTWTNASSTSGPVSSSAIGALPLSGSTAAVAAALSGTAGSSAIASALAAAAPVGAGYSSGFSTGYF